MNNNYSNDPKITYALYKLEDCLSEQQPVPDPDFFDITSHKEQVFARYQPIFTPDHIPSLTRDEFESFLDYKNNHHWTGLNRVKKHMSSDMGLLRKALGILLDENQPIQQRINKIRPYYHGPEDSMVSHLGLPVLTGILIVAHPEKYGVWNSTSNNGMDIVRLWDPRWNHEKAGDVYTELNGIYLYLCSCLKIDLWTLDALWWVLKK